MFWALAQWQKEKDKTKKERLRLNARAKAAGEAQGLATGREEGRAEGFAEGKRGIIVAMWNKAQSDEERAYIRRIAEEHGVALPIP